jgi:hypothetical protein
MNDKFFYFPKNSDLMNENFFINFIEYNPPISIKVIFENKI